ncbi:MAG: hypothetical protein DLM67_00205 [Candidatus Nephthysia bennettiae]|nr:MAG: hypothetical protein DLM67_00205 [Candidatus Dormibacteraeota bacterium]
MEETLMIWLAAVKLAFDPTLAGPTATLKTALGNLFAIGLMVGAVYYLFVARKVSKAITFKLLGAICAILFDVAAIESLGAGIKTLLGL